MKRVLLLVRTGSRHNEDMARGVGEYAAQHEPWEFVAPGWRSWPATVDLAIWEGDGILMAPGDERQRAQVEARDLPVVDLSAHPSAFGVTHDFTAAGRLAAAYLLERGYRRLAYLGNPRTRPSRLCRPAYEQAAVAEGLRVEVFEMHIRPEETFSESLIIERLGDWLAGLAKPAALLAYNDIQAHRAVIAARARGLQVPGELSILGIGDDLVDDLIWPTLSSIALDCRRVGYEAAAMLDDLMAGRRPTPPHVLVPPLKVTERRSTGALGVEDPDVAAAVAFIRSRGHQALSTDDVLARVPVSRSTLERRFRQHLGHSPWREIRLAQIRHLQRLLLETDWPIKRIASRSVFRNTSRFVQVFREETGETPAAYRRRHRLV